MQIGLQVTGRTPLQIPPQPSRPPVLQDPYPLPTLVRAIIMDPSLGMETPLQPQTPPSPRTCGPARAAGTSCWSLDMRVAVLLLTVAGAVILLLLYRLLQFRHRLNVARARHALEYHSFYRTATYTLKHPSPPCQDLPAKNGTVPDAVTPVTIAPVPPLLVAAPPPLPLPPPPALRPPSLPPTPPAPSIPPPLPVIHTTPPSPHLSWGACSDADVYSRIGAFRASRLSSLSNLSTHSKVILFEHSSL